MVDGKQVADTVKIPQTDSWNTYTTVDGKTSEIEAGDHILRVRISGAYSNVDWIAFAETKEELEELTGNIDILSSEPKEATVVDMMGKTWEVMAYGIEKSWNPHQGSPHRGGSDPGAAGPSDLRPVRG
jgi:hypothetical protein